MGRQEEPAVGTLPGMKLVLGLVASAVVLALVTVPGSTRRAVMCLGGCYTHGPPMPLQGAIPPVSKTQARQQALADYPDDPKFNQVVQLGEHSTGKPFQTYVPDHAVMGKPYEDTPFSATIDSVPIHNPSREWDSLDYTKNDVRR